MKDTVGDYKTY